MKKILFVLCATLLPALVCAQATDDINTDNAAPDKVFVERYNPRDQRFIDLEAKHRAEINRSIDNTLRHMDDKQIAVMTSFMNANETKKAKLSGDFDSAKYVDGKDAKSIKKYIEDSFNAEIYVPMSEPELVEVTPAEPNE